jgi:hypothetical protein
LGQTGQEMYSLVLLGLGWPHACTSCVSFSKKTLVVSAPIHRANARINRVRLCSSAHGPA